MKGKIAVALALALIPLVILALSVAKRDTASPVTAKLSVPVTTVKRGNVSFVVNARGELQGGNTQTLAVPMTGGGALTITSLRQNGEEIQEGDEVVAFDTTEQEFNLREAEADLAEAEQQVIQAKAESEAREQETLALLVQARTEVRVMELECRRNELYARITARQNELAMEAARDKLKQLENDLANRKATSTAAIALQEAARAKAKVKADIARRNIDSMSLKAKAGGYVAIQPNTDGMVRWGMQLPVYQVGDTVRPGMTVAQIPDMDQWEAIARIGELDRGHLAEGQPAEVRVVALPGRLFHGKVKVIGGTTGPPWDRRFDCRIRIEDPAPDLRPGMSLLMRIRTGQLDNVLWVPSQALFEAGGRQFVYLRSGNGFVAKDVKLVRKSEERSVIAGLEAGQQVAMASPDQASKPNEGARGAMQALTKQ